MTLGFVLIWASYVKGLFDGDEARGLSTGCREALIKDKQRREKYQEYLESDRWKEKRRDVFASQGRFCAKCGETQEQLHIHHLTYERFGNERIEDLQVLCKSCHLKHHKIQRQPQRLSKKIVFKKKKKKKVYKYSGYKLPSQPTKQTKKITLENERLHAIQVANRKRREYQF